MQVPLRLCLAALLVITTLSASYSIAAYANPATSSGGTWTTVAPMPTARGGLAAATGSDGRIYAIGGGDAAKYLNTVQAYNPATNSWTTVGPMLLGARGGLAAALGPDGRIYAIGGLGLAGKYLDTVEVYNANIASWMFATSMPTARGGLAAATGPDGKIYAIGGYAPSTTPNVIKTLDTVEAYNPATDTWTQMASMPTGRAGLAAATGPDGKIYAIGGLVGAKDLNTVEAYTPATNSWTTVAPMPTARSWLAAVTGSDGRIYAIGGFGGPNTVEAYDVTTNSWTQMASMQTTRSELAAALGPDGRIYAIGGLDGNQPSNTVEAYSLAPSSATPTPTAPTMSTTAPPTAFPTSTPTSQPTVPTTRPPSQKPIIPKTTKVLSSSAMQKVVSGGSLNVSRANLTLQFKQPGPTLKSLKPGNVIVSGVTKETPYGLLRKVSTVTRSRNAITVRTMPAVLPDAVTQGSFDLHGSAGSWMEASRQASTSRTSVNSRPSQSHVSKCITLNNTSLYSKGGVSVVANGQACYDGDVDVSASWSLGLNGLTFQETFTANGTMTNDLKLTLAGSLDATGEVKIGEADTTVVVPIQGVPVVVHIKIPLSVGFRAHASAGVTQHVVARTPITTSVYCDSGAVILCTPQDVSIGTPSFSHDAPTFSSEATLSGYARLSLEFLIYYLAGPEISLEGSITAHVHGNNNPPWALDAALTADADMKFDFLGVQKQAFGMHLWDGTWPVAQGAANPTSVPTPTRTAVPTTRPSGPPAAPSNLQAIVVDDGTTDQKLVLDLHWNDNSENEDGFRLHIHYDSLYGTSSDGTQDLPANSTSYRFSVFIGGINPLSQVCFTVTAFNTYGESSPSNRVCAPS